MANHNENYNCGSIILSVVNCLSVNTLREKLIDLINYHLFVAFKCQKCPCINRAFVNFWMHLSGQLYSFKRIITHNLRHFISVAFKWINFRVRLSMSIIFVSEGLGGDQINRMSSINFAQNKSDFDEIKNSGIFTCIKTSQ